MKIERLDELESFYNMYNTLPTGTAQEIFGFARSALEAKEEQPVPVVKKTKSAKAEA